MSLTSVSKGCRLSAGPVHLLIDSTGLKVYGAGEWLQEKHGVRARRTWRKLHRAVDALTGMILASTLPENASGDPSQVAPGSTPKSSASYPTTRRSLDSSAR